eukprot:4626356-Amphidinium_carterae.3
MDEDAKTKEHAPAAARKAAPTDPGPAHGAASADIDVAQPHVALQALYIFQTAARPHLTLE